MHSYVHIYKMVFNIFSYKSITSHFNVICYRHRSFHCSKLHIKCKHTYRRTTPLTSNSTCSKTLTTQRAFVCARQPTNTDIHAYKITNSVPPHLLAHKPIYLYIYTYTCCLHVSVYMCVLKSNHRDGVNELKINGEFAKKRRC